MAKDLRTFLKELEREPPEEFLKVQREVDPVFELPAVLRKLMALGKSPAVFFEKVKGSSLPVVSNIFASRRRLAMAFGTATENLLWDYMKLEDQRLDPKKVRVGPVKENVFTGAKVDVRKFPLVTHCEKDAGPYVTAGVAIFRDPDSGNYDTGIFRMQLKGPSKFGVLFGDYSKAAHVIRKNEAKGLKTECAVFIGHHPACVLASQTKVPFTVDEFSVMSGLLREPVELVDAETVDLVVPARAEIVMEGAILPKVREPEAPFGEYTWYYGLERPSHVMMVSAVLHRDAPIYHDIFSAHPDHNMCAVVQREAVLYKRVQQAVPSVKAASLPISGLCRHIAYVSIHKEFDGQGKIAALAALAADPLSKLVVVVDDDIDVRNESEVWWAITTRAQVDRATFTVPEAYVSELDPSSYSVRGRNQKDSLNTKWAIDATMPVGLPFEERADVPRRAWVNLDLKRYVPNAT